MSLSSIVQNDFAVGTLRGIAPDVQPGIGMHTIVNGLLDDDGDIYRRGGSEYLDPGFHLEQPPITWIWSGTLGGAHFTLLSNLLGTYTFDGALITGSDGMPRPVQCAVVDDVLYLPHGQKFTFTPGTGLTCTAWGAPPYLPPTDHLHIATIAGRLVVATGDVVGFSVADPVKTFQADDFHKLPGGVEVRGLAAIQDTLLVFTNYGLWAIGNMAYNLTDAAGNIQQTLSLIVPEMSLLHEAGITPWQGRFIAPCADRIYFVDAVSPPVPISDSITPMYAELVRTGARPGLAKVYRNTLFLPMLRPDPDLLEEVVVATLTCRVDRPIRGRYTYFPWGELRGHAAKARAFDIATETPNIMAVKPDSFLLGGGEDGYISNLSDILRPSADNTLDADGSPIEFELETRDFPTGTGQPNHLKRVRLRYTAIGAGTMGVSYSSDPEHTVWTPLTPAVLLDGTDPIAWWLAEVARARYVRLRFTTSDPLERLVVHQIELNTRIAAHAR